MQSYISYPCGTVFYHLIIFLSISCSIDLLQKINENYRKYDIFFNFRFYGKYDISVNYGKPRKDDIHVEAFYENILFLAVSERN